MLPRQRRRDNRRSQGGGSSFVGSLRGRMFALSALMFLGFGVLALRLLGMAFFELGEPDDGLRTALVDPTPHRGVIRDRQGQLLVTTLSVKSLFADPVNILDKKEVAQLLPKVLPTLNEAEILKKLTSKRRFVWLKRHLTPQEVYAVNGLGLPGLGFRDETQRFYPAKNTAAHLLGATNYQNEGVSGVELVAGEALTKGDDVSLTLDLRLQNALHTSLREAIQKNQAKGAWGVTLDAQTAEILAMVSLPDYNPNAYSNAPQHTWLNRTLTGVYEMGSIFKLFTHAMGFEEGTLSLHQEFDCRKPLRVGRYRIHDFYPKNAWLSTEEVFIHSSNIGAAQIADKVGGAQQQAYLANLGLFDRYQTGAGYVAKTMAPDGHRWGKIQTMSVSYGHGMAVTALQMVAAARSVLVDGVWRQPYLFDDVEKLPERKVFSPYTVEKMRYLAQAVVTRGTGYKAKVEGYTVGGKTGTAEKNTNGRYVKDRSLASFVGAIPLEAPKLVTLIMVDEPKEGGGGSVAAPAFASFSKKAMAILGVAPTLQQKEPHIREKLIAQHKKLQQKQNDRLRRHVSAVPRQKATQ